MGGSTRDAGMIRDYMDTPGWGPMILGLVAAALVGMAMLAWIDMDDSKTNVPVTLPETVYVERTQP